MQAGLHAAGNESPEATPAGASGGALPKELNDAETKSTHYLIAMDLLMQRERRRLVLVPSTAIDEERVRSIRCFDQPMLVRTHYTRTGKLNRWYRGLVSAVADGIGANPDALHCELKFRAGLVEQIIPVRSAGVGGVAVRLQSTSYPTMDDTAFSHYCDVAVEIICRDYLDGISRRQAQKQILEWVGHRPAIDPPSKDFTA